MEITSIKLSKYKPLMHRGISDLEIDITDGVVPIIGQNGSGKSSLLRELSVYPPLRADYEKEGSRILTVTHEGSNYTLVTRFNGQKGIHEFIRDGVDLNESSNSTTQSSLCEAHFGITPLIQSITSGKLCMSEISRIERKNLLAACYPSDMTFILKHHKAVCSRIRATKANLKMMRDRQLELANAMLSEEEFIRLSQVSSMFNDLRANADRWIQTFRTELAEWQEHPAYTSRDGFDNELDIGNIKATLADLCKKHNRQAIARPDITSDTDTSKIAVMRSSVEMRSVSLVELKDRTDKIVAEIDEYEALSDRNLEEEVNTVLAAIEALDLEISSIEVDERIPLIKPTEYARLNLQELSNTVSHIHGVEGTIMLTDKLRDTRDEIRSSQAYLHSQQTQLVSVNAEYSRLKRRFDRENGSSFNVDCVLPCQLKDNFNEVISEIRADMEMAATRAHELRTTINDVTRVIELAQKAIAPSVEAENAVLWIERLLHENPHISFILNDEDLVTVINSHPFIIHNNLQRLIDNASAAQRIEGLRKELQTTMYRHKVLMDSQVPTKEFVSKHLIDRKTLLVEHTMRYQKDATALEDLKETLDGYVACQDRRDLANDLAASFVDKANYQLIANKIKQLLDAIELLSKYRELADEKQAEVKNVVREQSHHRIRLHEEVEPTIARLEKELEELEIVESALSPNTGVGHVYMVRFLNSLIETVNDYIRAVWNNVMEVKPLKESNSLDFTFPVMHRESSTVKDMSVCSKSEQEIINLSWNLALCSHMGLSQNYPIRSDEVDSGMTPGHRQNLLTLLSTLTRQGDIQQLFIVNHHPGLYDSFVRSQIICLNPDGIVLPAVYNLGVSIN